MVNRHKLIILDRDGVINHDSDQYIKSPEEWQPIAVQYDQFVTSHHVLTTFTG